MSGAAFIRQTIPTADLPFVDPRTGRLSMWAVTYLQRLGQATGVMVGILTDPVTNVAIENVTTLIEQSALEPGAAPSVPVAPVGASPLALMPPALPADIVTLHSGARLLDGQGDPNGVVPGNVGDLFLRRDGAMTTALYIKGSGAGTDEGWSTPGTDTGLLPLANGDLPGPALISDPLGQTIGCPV
jgi:hypothetical protein